MTVQISVFAVVLIVTCVSAVTYIPPPSSTLTLQMPFMPKYPDANPTFNEFKKSVYTLNQALFNIIAAARSAYNYNTLYKDQQGLNLQIEEKKENFDRALNFFENKLLAYRQALNNYKTLLDYKFPSIPSLDDDIPIEKALLNY